MFVKQVSIYIENIRGALNEVVTLMGEGGIDLMALSVADTASFGIVRCIVKEEQLEKASAILREAGHISKINNVICVCVPDKPMGLATVLDLIKDAGISIEYIYSFYKNTGDDAVLILRPSEKTRCVNVLNENGIRTLTQEEINAL